MHYQGTPPQQQQGTNPSYIQQGANPPYIQEGVNYTSTIIVTKVLYLNDT